MNYKRELSIMISWGRGKQSTSKVKDEFRVSSSNFIDFLIGIA